MTNEIAILAGRLATGWILCEQETDPRRRHDLEDHWLRLLDAYVAAVDVSRLGPAGVAPPTTTQPARPGSPHPPRADRHRQEVA